MSKADEIKDEKNTRFLKFLEVASNTAKEKGKQYEFECPLCKGKTQCIRSTYNGHLWAKCQKCDTTLIE